MSVVPHYPPPGPPPPPQRPSWADRLAKHPSLTIAAVAIGLGSLIVGTVAYVNDEANDQVVADATEPSAVEAKALSGNATVTQFVLPLDAPLEEFPQEESSGCTPNQIAWLRAHGRERRLTYPVSIRNTATGAVSGVAMNDVRLIGDFAEQPEDPSLLFDCPNAGMSETVSLDIEVIPGAEATARDQTGEPMPFGFNLAPSELGNLEVNLGGDSGFTGALEAVALSGTESSTVKLLDISLPAIGKWGGILVSYRGPGPTFFCETNDETHDLSECDAAAAREMVSTNAGADPDAPVFGMPVSTPSSQGLEEVRPKIVTIGGHTTNIVDTIRWDSWGGQEAIGEGRAYYVPDGAITADAIPVKATIIAFDLGPCRGRLSYRQYTYYYPDMGETRSDFALDICED